ncbi:MAG: hypothetical protein KIT31_06305 [Deltaproteobacteria bacterium]|nr:hypothetical protein [Deltaproteobacteria bacterium]
MQGRMLAIAALLAGCGGGDGAATPDAPSGPEPIEPPPAPAVCSPVAVYLHTGGGTFLPSAAGDARDNTSSLLAAPVTFAAVDATRAATLATRLATALDFYHVPLATQRPNDDTFHFMLVLASDGIAAAFPDRAVAAPRKCFPQYNTIAFVDAAGATADDVVVARALAATGQLLGLESTTRTGDCMNEDRLVAGCNFGYDAPVANSCGKGAIQDEANGLAGSLGCKPPPGK